LIFAPKVAQPLDAAGDLIKQDLLPEDAILDPSDVLALDNLTAEGGFAPLLLLTGILVLSYSYLANY
jgi:hypothetical protein